MKTAKWICAGLLAVVLSPVMAKADVIYAQGQDAAVDGGYAGNNPFAQGNNFVAQDLSVVGSWILESITYNAYTVDSNTVPVTDFYANIYADNAGTVGALLYSEHVSGTNSGIVTGANWHYTLRDYTFDLLGGFVLNDGDYWLALHVGPDQGDMHWTIPVEGIIGNGSSISYNGGSSYSNYLWEHTFRLEGSESSVPEPGTMALFGIGLAGMGLARRRRKA